MCFIDHLLTLQLWSCRNLRRGCLIQHVESRRAFMWILIKEALTLQMEDRRPVSAPKQHSKAKICIRLDVLHPRWNLYPASLETFIWCKTRCMDETLSDFPHSPKVHGSLPRFYLRCFVLMAPRYLKAMFVQWVMCFYCLLCCTFQRSVWGFSNK